MKILIADDESGIVELIRQALERRGHSVDVAYDGSVAMERLKGTLYDIAFLDITMPEVTGLEIVDYIKKTGLATKSVIVTGYELIQDEFAKDAGADEYLSKPFKFEQIEAILQKYHKN